MYSESHLNILRQIDSNPHVSQRKLASNLGLSLGKVNYCVQALVEKGLLKAGNFSRSNDKGKYLYILTPAGIEEKAKLTTSFLKRKIEDHDKIIREIDALRRESKS